MTKNYMERSVGDFLNRNKNLGWTIFGTRLIFGILIVSLLFGGWLYLYLTDPVRSDDYIQSFAEGFSSGMKDGYKDSRANGKSGNYLSKTAWYKYTEETEQLQKQALKEKEQYLLKFPKEERDKKRAEMALNGFRSPAQLELEKGRYTSATKFYRATAYLVINKEEYDNMEKYKQDLAKLAKRDGYIAGYAEGRRGKLPQDTTISDIYLSH